MKLRNLAVLLILSLTIGCKSTGTTKTVGLTSEALSTLKKCKPVTGTDTVVCERSDLATVCHALIDVEHDIRRLEADLAASQYQLSAREAEFQERLMQVDQDYSDKLEKLEKKHMDELAAKKRDMGEDFLEDKKELRKTVIDLTKQFNDLRQSSADRIRDLENEIEQKDFKLGLLENRSKQDLLGEEEKWQAKLTAIQERHSRELMEQKQELQY